jgi:MFS family permease
MLTGATAVAPDATTFVALQFLARVFASAETAIAVVVIAEEFDPEHRGWGIGALGALHACGAGLAAVMFSFVEVLPFGWRALYAVGLVPLLLVAYLRRTLPETRRFDALELAREPGQRASLVAPVRDLVTRHPQRVAALAFAVVAIEVVMGPSTFFAPKFLQDVHGWSAAQVGLLNAVGGAFAIVGNSFAGWLSDRRGRRPVAIAFAAGFGLVTAAFYSLPGVLAPLMWILLIFGLMGTTVTLQAYGAEMFPTSVRSTASGARELFKTSGAVAGLALVSLLYGFAGSNWQAIVLLCAVGALSPLCVMLAFPETAGRELEEIAKE